MSRRWYQNVDGVEGAVFKDPKRKGSKFWGEGKWDTFVKPLLPERRETFIEIGCNAGLFLKLAMDAGFERVIGVESSRERIEQAERFRESNGYPYKLIHQKAGGDFDPDRLPLADVILLANVHYHLPIHVFASLIDRLRSRTMYCIIVSARVRRRQSMVPHYLEAVRGYFRDWEEVGAVGDWKGLEPIDTLDDPAPRMQMYGASFKGCLHLIDVKQACHKWASVTNESDRQGRIKMKWEARDFFRKVLTGEEFDFEKTAIYEYWLSEGWRPEDVKKKLAYHKSLAESIQRDGMREPIYYNRQGRLRDGAHRLIIADALGQKDVFARLV